MARPTDITHLYNAMQWPKAQCAQPRPPAVVLENLFSDKKKKKKMHYKNDYVSPFSSCGIEENEKRSFIFDTFDIRWWWSLSQTPLRTRPNVINIRTVLFVMCVCEKKKTKLCIRLILFYASRTKYEENGSIFSFFFFFSCKLETTIDRSGVPTYK